MQNADKTLILSFDPNDVDQITRLKSILETCNHSQWTNDKISRAIVDMRHNPADKMYISLDFIFAMEDKGYRSDNYEDTNLYTLKRDLDENWGRIWKTYNILGTGAGDGFDGVAAKAKAMAANGKNTIFTFNGVDCVVSPETNLEFLFRDYCNASYLEIKEVGPNCVAEYDTETGEKLRLAKEAREAELEVMKAEWAKEEAAKETTLASKIEGVTLDIIDQEYWDKCKEVNNDDGYGARCISYADEWGRLMQVKVAEYLQVSDALDSAKPDIQALIAQVANETSHEADYDGITGFMYGAAVQMLSKVWKYGEELRKWHNKEYKYEGEGTVNPAILTIG